MLAKLMYILAFWLCNLTGNKSSCMEKVKSFQAKYKGLMMQSISFTYI